MPVRFFYIDMTNHSGKKIAVFCGSSSGSDPLIVQGCINLAKELYSCNTALVYGGGNIGLMGMLADEMLRLGGEVFGVIPQKLVDFEVAHSGLTRLHIVPGMHERKALMAKLSDAFVVMPGGIGTMEEFFEMFTWLQLGYHQKPVAILNINGFYNQLISFLKHMVDQGFMKRNHLDDLVIFDHPVGLVNKLLKTS
jgi:uncharacterized protein (TIGR00730 family)